MNFRYNPLNIEHTYSLKSNSTSDLTQTLSPADIQNNSPSCNNTKLSILSPQAEIKFLQSACSRRCSNSKMHKSHSKSSKSTRNASSRSSTGDDRSNTININVLDREEIPQQIEISCHPTDYLINTNNDTASSSNKLNTTTRDLLTIRSPGNKVSDPAVNYDTNHLTTQDTPKLNHHRNHPNNESDLIMNRIAEDEKSEVFTQTAEDSGNDSDTDSDSDRLVIDMAPTLCSSDLQTDQPFQKQLSTSSCPPLLPVYSIDDQDTLSYKEIYELSAEENIEVALDDSPTISHSPSYTQNHNHHNNAWLCRDRLISLDSSDEFEGDAPQQVSFPDPFEEDYKSDQSEGEELIQLLDHQLIIPMNNRPSKKCYNHLSLDHHRNHTHNNNSGPKLNGFHSCIKNFTPPRHGDKLSRKKSLSSQHVHIHRQADNRNRSIEKALPNEIKESLRSIETPLSTVNTIQNEREMQWPPLQQQNHNHPVINGSYPSNHQHQSNLPSIKRNVVALNNSTNAKEHSQKHSKRFKSEPIVPQPIGVLAPFTPTITPPINIKPHQLQEIIRSPSPAQKQETYYMLAPSHTPLPYSTPGSDTVPLSRIPPGYPIYSLPQSQQVHAIHPSQAAAIYNPYGQPILIHRSPGPQIITAPHHALQQQYATHGVYAMTPQHLYALPTTQGELSDPPRIATPHNIHANNNLYHPLIYTSQTGNIIPDTSTLVAYQQQPANHLDKIE